MSAPEKLPRHPSSRRGGAILLSAIGALLVAAIVVVIVTSGARKQAPRRPQRSGSTNALQTSSTTSSAAGTTTTATPRILAQLNLRSPTGTSKAVGIVQVERVDGVVGIVIDAQGIPPNTKRNAYAVWLYNSASRYKFVGFVPNFVGKDGKLVTEGELSPALRANTYHHLLITLETQSKPKAPGEVVLSGPFREHS